MEKAVKVMGFKTIKVNSGMGTSLSCLGLLPKVTNNSAPLTSACRAISKRLRLLSTPDAGRYKVEEQFLMSTTKGPSEGGSGGKRGHSNMEHWGYTEEVKDASRQIRRKNDKEESNSGVKDFEDEKGKSKE